MVEIERPKYRSFVCGKLFETIEGRNEHDVFHEDWDKANLPSITPEGKCMFNPYITTPNSLTTQQPTIKTPTLKEKLEDIFHE